MASRRFGVMIDAPSSGVGVWGGVADPQPTRGSGERRELPQWGPGRSPGRYRIFCIF